MQKEYNIKDSSKIFLWALFLPQVISILLVTILSLIFTQEQLKNSYVYIIVMMLITQISFFLIFYFYNSYHKYNHISQTSIKTKFSIKNALLCVLISVLAVAGFINFVGLFDKLITLLGFSVNESSIPLNTPLWLVLNIVITAIIPAVMEEIIFRGMIFNGLKGVGFWLATFISSLFFMIEHLSVWSFVYPLLMGVIFCLILRKTGSIVYTMITHFCNNLIVVIINYYNEVTGKNFGAFNISSWWGGVLAVMVAVVSFCIIYFIIQKFMKNAKIKNEDETENNAQPSANLIEQSEGNGQASSQTILTNIVEPSGEQLKKQKQFLYLTIGAGVLFWLFIIIFTRV